MEERFKKDVEDFQNAESRIMGDFKGTKGEWAFYEIITTYISGATKTTLSVSANDYDIALVGAKNDLSEEEWGEVKANAQLIAASPKLLVELYQMTLLLKALPENNSEMSERIESAGKTINKALGL